MLCSSSSSLRPRLLLSSIGDGLSHFSKPLHPFIPIFNLGNMHFSIKSSINDLFFNKRKAGLNVNKKQLQPGKVSPCLSVPDQIARPPYVGTKFFPEFGTGSEVHDMKGVECMRASGKLAAQVLQHAGTLVKPGITTDEIDMAVHQMIIENGAYPSPLGYGGFPKSVCTSVNECICHGIPDSRELENGDIINIDVTVYLNGYHGDTSKTFLCGDVDDKAKKLVEIDNENNRIEGSEKK